MFTEFEIISMGLSFLAGFIIFYLEWREALDRQVEYRSKYEKLLKNFQQYVTEYKLQEKKENGENKK